jgi:serine/threonine-protein kinase
MVLREKYRLDGVLGVGGMAAVYAATHRNQKQFAIKILHPEVSAHADIRLRFLREGYLANSVKHPGAVAVLDDDEAEDGSAFLVMELLEGASLDAIWERLDRRVPLRAALCIVHQLLDVLGSAHGNGIVHRDIKPSNLFLLIDGQLKVLDFGIARLRDAATNGLATGIGTMLGTPAFMAPEQALAQTNDIDARSDIWSVGATLFTLISGQFVHPGDSEAQVLVRAATQRARSLAEVRPETPASVVELTARALAFEKAERWPSARLLREAVARIHAELYGQALSKEHLVSLFDEQSLSKGQQGPAIAASPTATATPGPLLQPMSSAPPTSGPMSRTTTVEHGAASQTALAARRRRRVLPVLAGIGLAGALAAATLIRLRPVVPSENGTAASQGDRVIVTSQGSAAQPSPTTIIAVDRAPSTGSASPAIATAAPIASEATTRTMRRLPSSIPMRSGRVSAAASAAIVPQPNASSPSPASSGLRSPLDMHLQ